MTSTWDHTDRLEPSECMNLLASARLGRVGWTTDEGPQILPVNHAVLDGAIVIRTDLYSVVADGTRDSTVAFQADELDDRLTSGWSVLVVGHAEHVDDPKEMAALFQRMHQPWAPGLRPLVARIVPAKVTGRRFTREG
jgi:nitroimidazol reductase NimA-like FMN-containing flavoprotein (pyridoxamine 5'-phosphate oxidase superfamily)